MKILRFAAFLAAIAIPVAASAQQASYPGQYPQQGGYQQGGPYQQQGTPRVYAHWMRVLQNVNLSQLQQQQIQGMIQQYISSHPQGSPPDYRGKQELRQQILGVLTPDQQMQVRQQLHAIRVQQLQQELQRAQQQPPR